MATVYFITFKTRRAPALQCPDILGIVFIASYGDRNIAGV